MVYLRNSKFEMEGMGKLFGEDGFPYASALEPGLELQVLRHLSYRVLYLLI